MPSYNALWSDLQATNLLLSQLTTRVANNEASTAAAFKAITEHLVMDDAAIAKLMAIVTPPAIVVPPPVIDPQIQWRAGMETGNLSEWEAQNNNGSAMSTAVQVAAENIPARVGSNWVMKQSVTGIGGTRMYVYSAINNIYRTGNPIYYSFWAYFPAVTTLGAGGFFNLLQIQSQGPTAMDPVWILGLHPSAFTLRLEWWGNLQMAGPHAGESGGIAYDQAGPIPVGRWTFIEVMVTPREDFTGAVKVWQDGALLFDLSSVKTKYPENLVPAGTQSFMISKNAYGQGINPLPHAHFVDDCSISLGRMPQ